MTETASKELCAELYKLTGWETDELDWWAYHEGRERMEVVAAGWGNSKEFYPAYSCGYLLRKLPATIRCTEHSFLYRWALSPLGEGYIAGYSNQLWVRDHKSALKRDGYNDEEIDALVYWGEPIYADTPEDALTKLAIELVKQGIVPKGDV